MSNIIGFLIVRVAEGLLIELAKTWILSLMMFLKKENNTNTNTHRKQYNSLIGRQKFLMSEMTDIMMSKDDFIEVEAE